jgi:hypothetical protein
MKIRGFWNKHEYIKVYTFHANKTLTLRYHVIVDFKPAFLINSEHIFNSGGYQTVITSEKACETINPLDFASRFNPADFTTAIQSKVIRETFGILETGKIDIMKVLLFVNIGINLLLVYLLLKNSGVV